MAHILPHRLSTVEHMCGRYVAKRGLDDLAAEFEAEDALGSALRPDYNIAPTDLVPVVVLRHRSGDREGPRVRQLRAAKWGLVPSWATDTKRAAKLINARAETVTELLAFRSAVRRRRCLVPADGWYEWAPLADGPGKQPTYLTPASGDVIAFAGLYEIWGPDRLLTSSIVTTAAAGPLAAVHHRMPLMLPRASWPAWLDPDREEVGDLLMPDLSLVEGIELRPVGPAVGTVANDGPGLIERATTAEATAPTLF
ncbi:MAG TPA: SOS response-associated peptidase [Mycobacteriales bacterium]|nr:SOS response-associated peptidase [Mycobacteriales bacterium]